MIYRFIKKYRSAFRASEDVPGFRSIKELILWLAEETGKYTPKGG